MVVGSQDLPLTMARRCLRLPGLDVVDVELRKTSHRLWSELRDRKPCDRVEGIRSVKGMAVQSGRTRHSDEDEARESDDDPGQAGGQCVPLESLVLHERRE